MMAERSSLLVTSPTGDCDTDCCCILIMNKSQQDKKEQILHSPVERAV
jgi:hypothetical protein